MLVIELDEVVCSLWAIFALLKFNAAEFWLPEKGSGSGSELLVKIEVLFVFDEETIGLCDFLREFGDGNCGDDGLLLLLLLLLVLCTGLLIAFEDLLHIDLIDHRKK